MYSTGTAIALLPEVERRDEKPKEWVRMRIRMNFIHGGQGIGRHQSGWVDIVVFLLGSVCI